MGLYMSIKAKEFKDFNAQMCLELYRLRKVELLCQEIFAILKHCNDVYYTSFSKEDLKGLNSFVGFILFLFTQEDFRVPDNWVGRFVNMNHLLINLVAISGYRTTDGAVRTLLNQDGNYAKILTLYTCRNEPVINMSDLVKPNPILGSVWWNNFSVAPPGSTSELVHEQMLRQLREFPVNLTLPDYRVEPNYFQCSYYGIDERPIKEKYNEQVRKFTAKHRITSVPKKGSIAIVTDKWATKTAVYKSSYPQIAALASKYDLTLVCSSKVDQTQLDTSIFKNIATFDISIDKIDLTGIANNEFELAYFPDIGMTDDSVFLANTKIAPIMVCGYGHPASTYGARDDYFIGGLESEDASLYQENYSERLVLIPGLGAHPVDPMYTRNRATYIDKTYINCCWTTSKINWPMLKMLQNVLYARPDVHYQFFPSWTSTRYNNFIILNRELTELFKGHVSVYPDLPYHDYLAKMEQGTLTIDSHPFGGYNTVVDSFFVGCPVVTIEGTKFYNRASSALCRRVGLDFCAKSIDECESTLVRVLTSVTEPLELEVAREKLADVGRLRKLLIDTDETQYFVKAIDYILENHPISGHEPLTIR
jgi:hypothetical protein